MMRKLTRRSTARGYRARVGLVAALATAFAACGTDSILDGGNGGGNGGGGGGGGTPVGRTFHAASSSAQIGDLVVDAERGSFYISNKANNSIDMIDWSGASLSRSGRALVGSLPWGLDIDLTGDTLIVANSGGTSLSFVDLNAFTEARRFNAPNATLWQLSPGEDDSTATSVVVSHIDFADRPQFVTSDASGVVFYSTHPTSAAPDGSIRMVQKAASWQQRESDLVLWTEVLGPNAWGPGQPPLPCYDLNTLENIHEPGCGIAFVDSVRIHYESPVLGTQLRVYDHVPGFPNQVIADTSSSWYEIDTNLRARGSDIFMKIGTWNLDEWVNADTTYLAAAGNRSWVTIAEGARETGRVWLWGAIGPHPRLFDRWISDVVNISDYANNTSAPITGISVNHVGDVIATRSGSSVFFLTNPMRLMGSYTAADVAGGGGVAVHPRAGFAGADVAADWAVVGGAGPELIIIDTRHFRRVGRITLMERVAGSLRLIDRLPGDAPEVLGHAFGVMGSGRVFHTPITTSDSNP
jgi:hypothetical protein